ncbi:MAG: FAD-dependent oxidoreductase [Verrucomicrobia bacterium]|nr:FAD-dependent oxidoreductase [Verrucomicrobiota bacterium]
MAKIAILGTGIAGMGCAHFLHRHHDLTLFEANDYVGGHANTIGVPIPGTDRTVPIDTGFMVYNETNCPLLARLFAALQVPVKKTTRSFSVRDDRSGLEWSDRSLNHLFAQRKNLADLRFLKLLRSVHRFNQESAATLDDPETDGITLGEHLRRRGYGEDLFNLHLAPLGASLWNTPPDLLLSFPAGGFLRFCQSHGFLGFRHQQAWLAVDGGAREYRDRLIAPWRDRIRQNCAAVRIIRHNHGAGAMVMANDGTTQSFDKVIVATHADQALRLLVNPTPDEARLLGEFNYHKTTATLHTDSAVLPRTPLARAACNHQLAVGPDGRPSPATHYWMNALQDLPGPEHYFVSFNRPEAIDPAKVIKRIDYTQPSLTPGALRAQAGLPGLNEQARSHTETYFVGSYFRHGLHEDALMSAVKVSELVLEKDPWTA